MRHGRYRIRNLVAAPLAGLLAALALTTPADALVLARFDQTTSLIGANPNGNKYMYAVPDGTGHYRSQGGYPIGGSPNYQVLCSPWRTYQTGDIVHLVYETMVTNQSHNPAKGEWRVWDNYGRWIQSEHWGLWIMAATTVFRQDGAGHLVQALRQLDENWDTYIHHKVFSRSVYYAVPAGAFRFCATFYLRASGSYVVPFGNGSCCEVAMHGNGHSRLQVALFRE